MKLSNNHQWFARPTKVDKKDILCHLETKIHKAVFEDSCKKLKPPFRSNRWLETPI